MGERRTTQQKLDAETRANEWLELRLQSVTYRKIGKQYGVSGQYVHQIVSEKIAGICLDNATNLKTKELEALDDMESDLIDAASAEIEDDDDPVSIDQRLRIVDRRLKIMERRAKLTGIDMAEKVEVVDSTPDHLKKLLASVKQENYLHGVEVGVIPTRENPSTDTDDGTPSEES